MAEFLWFGLMGRPGDWIYEENILFFLYCAVLLALGGFTLAWLRRGHQLRALILLAAAFVVGGLTAVIILLIVTAILHLLTKKREPAPSRGSGSEDQAFQARRDSLLTELRHLYGAVSGSSMSPGARNSLKEEIHRRQNVTYWNQVQLDELERFIDHWQRELD